MKKDLAVTPRRLFDDVGFLSLSQDAQHLLLRLYVVADDWGRFPVGETILKAVIKTEIENIDDVLSDLTLAGFLVLYFVDGYRYGAIVAFDDDVEPRLHKRRLPSKYPEPIVVEAPAGLFMTVPKIHGLRRAVELVATTVVAREDAAIHIVGGVMRRLEDGYSAEVLARALYFTIGDTMTDAPERDFWPRLDDLYGREQRLLKEDARLTEAEEGTIEEIITAIAQSRYRTPVFGEEGFDLESHAMQVRTAHGDTLRRLAVFYRPHFVPSGKYYAEVGVDEAKNGYENVLRPLVNRLKAFRAKTLRRPRR
mgnify:CR=1 FL=1